MNAIKLQYKMDIINMNSEKSKISHRHRLLLNLSDKINLSSYQVTLSSLSFCYT